MANELVQGFSKLLAESYLIYLKTHNFHWNVTGPRFHSLHTMFEEQYSELATAIDEIAERIRALGAIAPGSFEQFKSLTDIKECTSPPSADEMLVELAENYEQIIATAQDVRKKAEDAGDEASADLAIERTQVHQKTLWMLRSSVG